MILNSLLSQDSEQHGLKNPHIEHNSPVVLHLTDQKYSQCYQPLTCVYANLFKTWAAIISLTLTFQQFITKQTFTLIFLPLNQGCVDHLHYHFITYI